MRTTLANPAFPPDLKLNTEFPLLSIGLSFTLLNSPLVVSISKLSESSLSNPLPFEMPEIEYNERTCIIVISVNIKGEKKTIGVVVDGISEVLDIKPEDIEPAPEYGSGEEVGFIKGIGKFRDKIIMMLGIDEVVCCEDVAAFFRQEAKKSLAQV